MAGNGEPFVLLTLGIPSLIAGLGARRLNRHSCGMRINRYRKQKETLLRRVSFLVPVTGIEPVRVSLPTGF